MTNIQLHAVRLPVSTHCIVVRVTIARAIAVDRSEFDASEPDWARHDSFHVGNTGGLGEIFDLHCVVVDASEFIFEVENSSTTRILLGRAVVTHFPHRLCHYVEDW